MAQANIHGKVSRPAIRGRAQGIFSSLRADYPGFDQWFDKCRKQHRDCWVLEIENEIAGLVIRKDENYAEAGTRNPGPKVLKICTFKVRDEFQGEKFGELLLKQVLWFVQRNSYDRAGSANLNRAMSGVSA